VILSGILSSRAYRFRNLVTLVRRFTSALALLLAIASIALAMFIVVPAPTRALLPLGVGAPEVSAWLVTGGIVALLLALPSVRLRWVSRVAVALAIVTIGVAATPLLRVGAIADNADEQLRVAFGGTYLESIPPAVRAEFRAAPLVRRDLFLGLPALHTVLRIDRHRPFAVIDADTLTLTVYAPSDTLSHAVLVQVYGGAWQRGTPDDYAEFAEYFAAQGYTVIAIDYRHAPRAKFPAQIDDVRRALAYIGAHATELRADTSRLALVGRSAGAHLAMMAAYATDAPRVRGVINFYGPVDLVEGYRQPPRPDPLQVRAVEEAFIGGTPDNMLARYRAASPISLVTRKLPPTLLLYGGRDHIVEPRFGDLLAGRLRAEGSTVVHVEIPWAEHAFDAVPQGPSSQLARYVTERFLASVMLGQ
jgi:acetyl esterase/lipase